MPVQLIHPAIVHFPIVFVLSLFAVDSFALARGLPLTSGTELGRASMVLAAFAALFAILAFVFGDQAYDIARAAGTSVVVLEPHEELGTITAVAVIIWGVLRGFIYWRGFSLNGSRSGIVVFADFVLVGLILITAFYGGQLVYEHGIAVMTSKGA